MTRPIAFVAAGGPARGLRQGLTLLEIALALGVLAILFTGVFSALSTGTLAAIDAREAQAATEEALRVMDLYTSQTVDALLANPEGYFPVLCKTGSRPDGTPKTASLQAGPSAMFGYTTPDPVTPRRPLYVRVVATPPPLGANLVEVQVMVCWTSTDRTNRRVDLVSRVVR